MKRHFLTVLATATLSFPLLLPAQVMHLAPIHRPTLPEGTPVMTVKLRANGDTTKSLRGAKFIIENDQIVIQRAGSTTGIVVIPLGDRDIRDVVNQLNADLDNGLEISTNYPMHKARVLGKTEAQTIGPDTFNVKASPDDPEVNLGFGLVLAMAEDGAIDEAREGVLSQTGFQFDVVGTHQVFRPQRSRKGLRGLIPSAYALVRLGLNANQQLQVQQDSAPGNASPAADQFQSALEQADQIAVTAQPDLVWPLSPERVDLILTPSFGVSWTQLDPLPLPIIEVGDAFLPGEEVFAADVVARARRDMQRTLPLSEWGAVATFHFRRNGRPLFYFGGGVVARETIRRGVRFQRDTSGTPDPRSLRGILETDIVDVWRITSGAQIAGVLDFRLDAAGPIGDRRAPPLLRVLIGRAFPVK